MCARLCGLIRALLVVGIFLLTAACEAAEAFADPAPLPTAVPGSTDAPPATSLSAARGKQLYDIHCFTCHGKAGERGAVPLRDVAPALDDTAIADAIVNGMPGKGMPRPPTLSAEQIADLVALIRSWQE